MSSSLKPYSPSTPLSLYYGNGTDESTRHDYLNQAPNAPRLENGSRFCIHFDDCQLQANAPLLPILSDDEDEISATHDEAILLRPRPSSSSIFRDNDQSSPFGISMASSVCSSMDECPSMARSLEDSFEMSEDDLSETDSFSFNDNIEKKHSDMSLEYLQPHQQLLLNHYRSDLINLRPRIYGARTG